MRLLSLPALLTIHHEQIAVFGGQHGVRNQSALEAALNAAGDCWLVSSDLYQTAAEYCVALVRADGFHDGNVRTAADCALTYLRLNGQTLSLINAQLYTLIMEVALGDLDRSGLAEHLRHHARPIDTPPADSGKRDSRSGNRLPAQCANGP